jgi:hypothetical protein
MSNAGQSKIVITMVWRPWMRQRQAGNPPIGEVGEIRKRYDN